MSEETIFESALRKRSPAERSAYLAEVCGGDAALRQRIEARLAIQEGTIDVPARPATGSSGFGLLPETLAPGDDSPSLPQGGGDAAAGETQGDPHAGGDGALDFLTPTGAPGVLGRLGHYDVLAVVGRGGMGVVLRAFDTKLHRVVAVKVMTAELAASAASRQRFIREARAAAAVCHENVVTIHAVEEEHRPPYLVMQYVEGTSLQDQLERRGPLPPREVLRIGRETAAGLAAAHKRGLIHRDIKPANILLEEGSERVKITDFGLARAADDASLTHSGVIAGTPQYMSPEQAEGQPLDARSDLFSLGSVLYALCTGRPPFVAGSTMAVLRRVCEDDPRPVREINPAIPDSLAEVIIRLHVKAPADRFASAAEVADVLGSCLDRLDAREPAPMPAPATEERPPIARKRRLRYAAVVLAVLALLGAGVVALYHRREKARAPDDAAPAAKVESSDTPAAELLREAVLVMDFDKDDFFQRDGKTYVRDHSGHGNDGLCEDVGFTSEGKVGGGLDCRGGRLRLKQSLVNCRPSFTITAWVRVRDEKGEEPSIYLFALAANPRSAAYRVGYNATRMLFTNAFNVNFPPDFWYPYKGPWQPLFNRGEWFFLAVTFRNGSANAGDVRLTVDGRTYSYPSQMADNSELFQEGVYDFLGNEMDGVLDEVTVFPRALSDLEVQAIRAAGKRGEPLSAARILSPEPPPAPPDFLRDAVLLMDFEKESFYDREGKTWVRDRSGHGHDGVCEGVAYTAEGKAGGGLACSGGRLRLNGSFINRLPNYTLTAWVRVEDSRGELSSIYARSEENLKNANYSLWVVGGNLGVHVFNQEASPDPWLSSTTNQPAISEGRWAFVAAVLRDGGPHKGDLRLIVNARVYDRKSQMVNGPEGAFFDQLGVSMKAILDEVTLFPRALSDMEIGEIRRQGLDGRPLGTLRLPRR